MEITEGLGPDVVIEAVGSPATYIMAIDEVGFTGRVVCIGYAKTEIAFKLSISYKKNWIFVVHAMPYLPILEQSSAIWSKKLVLKMN